MTGTATAIGQFLISSEMKEEKNTGLQCHTGRTEQFWCTQIIGLKHEYWKTKKKSKLKKY